MLTYVKKLTTFLNYTTVLLLLSSGLYGQSIPPPTDYIADVQHFSVEDGLSNRTVSISFQDSRGFMWFGTTYGLNRFNGKRFEIFTEEENGLAHNQVDNIIEDADGWLWIFHSNLIGHSSGIFHISFINIHTLEVKTIEERFGDDFPVPANEIYHAQANSDKAIFFLSKDGKQMVRFHPNDGFTTTDFKYGQETRIAHISENHFIFFNKQRKIIKTDAQLNLVWEREEEENPKRVRVIIDEKGNMGYLQSDYDLPQNTKLYQRNIDGELKEQLFENSIFTFKKQVIRGDARARLSFSRTTGNFWYHNTTNCFVFNQKHGIVFNFNEKFPEIPKSQVRKIFFDNKNNAWIGTLFGVFKVQLKANPFKKYDSLPRETYNTNIARSTRNILVRNDTLWFTNVKGSMTHIDLKTNEKKTLPKFRAKNTNAIFRPTTIFFIYPLDNQTFLLGGHAVIRFNTYTNNTPYISRYLPKEIWSIFQDNDQKIWMGCFLGGLYYLDKNKDSMMVFNAYNEFIKLQKSSVYSFVQWDSQHILVGSTSGIYLLHPQKGIIRRFWRGGKDKEYLPNNNVYHLYRDKEKPNIIWVGTGGGGLIRLTLDEKDISIAESRQFTVANSLTNNVIYGVYEDSRQNLWLPSDYGIIRFNKNTFESKAFTESDGITHNEFNRISHFQDDDGTLYFGGLNGITAFHPDELASQDEVLKAPFLITKFEQYDGQQRKVIDKTAAITHTPKITLSPSDQFFNIEFTLLEYQNGDLVKYSYTIEGQSEDWIFLDDNKLRISCLPYGRFTLKIRAQGADGQFVKEQIIIPISVLYPFYLKWWFVLLMILLATSVIYFVFQWRTGILQQSKEVLEELVQARIRTIEEQAEELRQMASMKSRFFANVSHEFRTPLTLIQAPIQKVVDTKYLDIQSKRMLERALRNSKTLYHLVSQILDLSKLDVKKLELNEESVLFYVFLRRIIANFENNFQQNELVLKFDYHLNGDVKLELDKEKFERILYNYISNAIKFTPRGGTITISVDDLKSKVRLTVKDTGLGIPEDEINLVFDRFYQVKRQENNTIEEDDTDYRAGTGIGLALCKEYATLFKGRVWAESKNGVGSTFYFEFPKKEIVAVTEVKDVFEIQQLEKTPIVAPLQSATAITPIENQEKSSILIAEDNHDLREFLIDLLQEDYQVIAVENGRVALEKLAQQSIDLIISDVMMPIMNGFELLKELKSSDKYRHIPVIMLTARVRMYDRLKALRIGVDDYMIKPFNESELKLRVNKLILNVLSRQELLAEDNNDTIVNSTHLQLTEGESFWLQTLEEEMMKLISNTNFKADDLTDKLFMSRSQIFKKIKKLTGLTLNEYIKELRLQKSRYLLENRKTHSVKDTASRVGFKHPSYFSKNYEKRFGKKPADYL
jgi:signal transduction histidine kinase/DNA-binding response OmpR family regulator